MGEMEEKKTEEQGNQPSSLKGAAPREIADRVVSVLDAKKARNIKLLYVEKQTILADYFVICEGTSNTQIKALAAELEHKLTLAEHPPLRIEGYSEGTWVLLDFASVIVHIFNRDMRDFYKLEKLWDDGTEIELHLED